MNRIQYLDVTKCFAIFCVILGHVIQWTCPTDPYLTNTTFQFIYSFHMPLFMTVSGFFIGKTFSQSPIGFLYGRSRRLLLPVLSFCTVYFLSYLFLHLLTGRGEPLNFVDLLFGGDMWFLKYLFVGSCVLWLSRRLSSRVWIALLPTLLLFVLTRATMFRLVPYLWLGHFLYEHREWLSRRCYVLLPLSFALFAFFLYFWHGAYDSPIRFLYFDGWMPRFDWFFTWAVAVRLGVGLSGSLFFVILFQVADFWLSRRKVSQEEGASSLSLKSGMAQIGRDTLGIYCLQIYLLEHYIAVVWPLRLTGPYALPLQLLLSVAILCVCDGLTRLLRCHPLTALLFLGETSRHNDKSR